MPGVFPAAGTPFGATALAIAVVLGLLSLFFGRRLFYGFVALAGFAFGLSLGVSLLGGGPGWMQLLLGIVVGALLALLAVVLQRPIAAVSGFLAFAAVGRLLGLSLATPALALVLALLFGIAGLVLVWLLFDWGLIIASALIGAATLTFVIRALMFLPYPAGLVIFLVLLVVGVLVQARSLRASLP